MRLAELRAALEMSDDDIIARNREKVIEGEFIRRYLACHPRAISEAEAISMHSGAVEYYEKSWKSAYRRDLEDPARKAAFAASLRDKIRPELSAMQSVGPKPAPYTKSRFILAANRGEIACRIIEQAHAAGKKVIVIHDGMDLPYEALLTAGDEVFHVPSYCDRGRRPREQRLDILSMKALAAYLSGAGIDPFDVTVHPGWGFNAEDDEWFEEMELLGFRMAGPHSSVIRFLGNKINATTVARHAGLSTPASSGKVESVEQALEFFNANKGSIRNFLLKDALGGGGHGQMMLGHADEREFRFSVETFLKKYPVFSVDQFLDKTRHIEFQFIGDLDGSVVFGAPRDCTQQRDRQKVIEETAGLAPEVEKEMRGHIRAFLDEIGGRTGHPYAGAGTFEFLYEPASKTFYFLEVNTRLQVEHPVSAHQDCVNYVLTQLDVTDGFALLTQEQVDARNKGGHAMEARICLERVLSEREREVYLRSGHDRTFGPVTGSVEVFNIQAMDGLTIYADRRIGVGSHWSGRYDSMIMKAVVHGKDRAGAIRLLAEAARGICIEGQGINTNRELILGILAHEEFVKAASLEERTAVKDVALNLQVRNEMDILKKTLLAEGAPEEFGRLFVSIGDISPDQKEHIKTELAALGAIEVFKTALARKRGGIVRALAGLFLPARPMAGEAVRTTIYPGAFSLLCKLLAKLGAEPSLAIRHHEDRKTTARKLEEKRVLHDPELLSELLRAHPGELGRMTQPRAAGGGMVTLRKKDTRDLSLRAFMRGLEPALHISRRETTSTFDHAPEVYYDIPQMVFPLFETLFVRERGEDYTDSFERVNSQ